MADSKISELNPITGSQIEDSIDLMVLADTSASETKKITIEQLFRERNLVNGTINGMVIGGSTPAAGSFTDLNASGSTVLSGNLTTSGTVGFGDTSPDAKLVVSRLGADVAVSGFSGNTALILHPGTSTATAGSGIHIVGNSSANTGVTFGTPTSGTQGAIFYSNSLDRMDIYTNGAPRVQIDNVGTIRFLNTGVFNNNLFAGRFIKGSTAGVHGWADDVVVSSGDLTPGMSILANEVDGISSLFMGTSSNNAAGRLTWSQSTGEMTLLSTQGVVISTGVSSRLEFDSGEVGVYGNLVVGTSTPWDFATSWRGIKVTGRHSLQATPLASSVALSSNASIGSTGWEYTASATNAGNITISGSTLLFYTAPSGTEGNEPVWTEEMRLNTSGVLSLSRDSSRFQADYVKTNPKTLASLGGASGKSGFRAFVTDSTLPASGNFGAVVSGGGSNNVPVYSDGSNWRIG